MTEMQRVYSWLLAERDEAGPEMTFPYEDIIRCCCVLAGHQYSLDLERLVIYRNDLTALGSMLGGDNAWRFSVSDLEPAWTRHGSRSGDYVSVYVVSDPDGSGFEVVCSIGGAPRVVRAANVSALGELLDSPNLRNSCAQRGGR
jgi:hypothetical protein